MVNFPITSSQLGRKVKQNGLLRGIGIFQPPFKNKVEASYSENLTFFVSKGGSIKLKLLSHIAAKPHILQIELINGKAAKPILDTCSDRITKVHEIESMASDR